MSKTKEYKDIMFKMFDEKKFNHKDLYKILAMGNHHLKKIHELGHLIGLHSHSHPPLLENLPYNKQLNEYQNNISILSKILNIDKKDIKYMSHPSGSYNENTLQILKNLGIELGFQSMIKVDLKKNMKKINNSLLETAREDHSNIIKMMN